MMTRFLISVLLMILATSNAFTHPKRVAYKSAKERQAWIEDSVKYYSKVMRGAETSITNLDEVPAGSPTPTMQKALKTYFAHRKIKVGANQKAEHLFRKLIDDIVNEKDDEEDCDCASLAVPTLLLALMLQREGRVSDARAVFDRFLNTTLMALQGKRCTCSARVFQAYALFEMKQGERIKSADLILQAIRMDPKLRQVLKWKQFRTALELRKQARQSLKRETTLQSN